MPHARVLRHRQSSVEQPGRRVDDDPAAGDVDLGHERGDERDQAVAAVGQQ